VRIALLFLTWVAALAQPAPAPAFEVASIRSVQPGRESIEFGPASLTMRYVYLTACIRWAYGVQDVQVSGPPWLSDVWFDIFAKSANPVSVAELRAMLRTLLAERFKLAVHRDSKEMTALVFTVGKDGHKLKAVDAEGSPSFEAGNEKLTGKGATVAQLVDLQRGEAAERKRLHLRGALLHQDSAVHHQAGAGDVAGVFGGQEDRGAGKIFGRAQAAERHHFPALHGRLFIQVVGADQAGNHGVHAHAVGSKVERHGPSHGLDAAFGGIVGDVAAMRFGGAAARHIDDDAGPLAGHVMRGAMGAQE
jgi:hypothetical protein